MEENKKETLFKLTKDNFNYQYSGDEDNWNWELANHPRYTNPWTKEEAIQLREQILSNQEKAERMDELYNTGYMAVEKKVWEIERQENKKLKEIVENLKKIYLDYCDNCMNSQSLTKLVGKLLAGIKDKN